MEEQSFTGFRVAADGTVGSIVLDRAAHLNPLSADTLLDLEAGARWFDARAHVRVVIVRGEGRAFSAGADLASFTPGGMGDRSAHDAGDAGRRMADAIEAMRAVAIAQIHGHCVGGGLVLAAACDLRIAATGTQFSIPEVDLGIPLAWGGIPRLVREIGPALTKELVMTCRPFDAEEALASGFLNRVVDLEELEDTVHELAGSIARRPAFAVQATKSATNAVTAGMVGIQRSWSDAEALHAGLRDAEGIRSREAYMARVKGDG
ncbi:MAG: enoyl-CoA hydratase/isomerase family protein [Acidimicrobiales bacterium]